jgi:hypothetical protein
MDANELRDVILQLKVLAALREGVPKEETTEWKAALILEQLMDTTYLRAMGSLNNV